MSNTNESNIVIATLDQNNLVVSFMAFSSEDQLDRMMKTCKQKGLKVRTMSEDIARKHMKDNIPVS